MGIAKKTKKVSKKDKVLNEPFLEDIKSIREKKYKKLLNKIELILIVVFSSIMLILLCNRTFFRTNYKNSKINIDIPLLMFFRSDNDNKLVLKSLRKSLYLREYFDEKLSSMTQYNCGDYDFYYDDLNYYAIYNIDINKDFFVKTVTINYASGDANCLCNAGVIGIEAEEICSK